jgi:protein gp37
VTTTTKIEWADKTWSPVIGCDRVSPGCDSCYAIGTARIRESNPHPKVAEAFAGTTERNEDGIDWTGKVNLLADRLTAPLRWKKPRKVFVNSLSDLFHDQVPDDFIAQVFAVMASTPQHTYQVLTKRHGRMRSLLGSDSFRLLVKEFYAGMKLDGLLPGRPLVINVWPLRNVWLGVSVENQRWADIRVPALMDTPAAVRFLSCEPLLGPVDLTRWLRSVPDCGHVTPEDGTCGHPAAVTPECHRWADCPARPRLNDWHGLDWVIAGGESGPRARPMHPVWVRRMRDECDIAGVPFFFKQWGEWSEADNPSVANGRHLKYRRHMLREDGTAAQPLDGGPRAACMERVGKRAAGRLLDGRTHDAFPRDDYRDSITSGLTESFDAFSRRLEAAAADTDTARRTR